MLEYRVTKYDPAFRDSRGAFTRDEWTAISDIGRTFGEQVLTLEEYTRVETAYVLVAESFLRETGQATLSVCGLENHGNYPIDFTDGAELNLDRLESVVRLLLREEFWCCLEGPRAYVHFGYDYYMYLGTSSPCPQSQELATRLGLFVEKCPSPYRTVIGE